MLVLLATSSVTGVASGFGPLAGSEACGGEIAGGKRVRGFCHSLSSN